MLARMKNADETMVLFKDSLRSEYVRLRCLGAIHVYRGLLAVRVRGDVVLEDGTALHDKFHTPHGGWVGERIAVHRDNVGLHAGSKHSDLIAESERLRRQ